MSIVKLSSGIHLKSSVFIAHGACVIGDVILDEETSIWYNCVLRGDVGKIFVGKSTNIQDLTMIHVDVNYGDTEIGDFVTVGHSCLLHACTISDNAFVGMGSIVMDGAFLEEHSMLAAGSLLTRSKVVRKGELWSGRPAKFTRFLTDEEIEGIRHSADSYSELAKKYK